MKERTTSTSGLRSRLRASLRSISRSRRTAIGLLEELEKRGAISPEAAQQGAVEVEAIAEALVQLKAVGGLE